MRNVVAQRASRFALHAPDSLTEAAATSKATEIPDVQNLTLETPSQLNKRGIGEIRCGRPYEESVPVASCRNALSKIDRSQNLRRFRHRPRHWSPGDVYTRTPSRYLSDDGLCAIDVMLIRVRRFARPLYSIDLTPWQGSTGDEVPADVIYDNANALVEQCILRRGTGGLSGYFNEQSYDPPKPVILPKDLSVPELGPRETRCHVVVNMAPNLAPTLETWFKIWAAGVAVNTMCVQHGMMGKAVSLGFLDTQVWFSPSDFNYVSKEGATNREHDPSVGCRSYAAVTDERRGKGAPKSYKLYHEVVMAEGSSIVQQLDAQLEQLFAGWNIYTTLLCVGIVTYLIYPIFFTQDPDTHPFLLARQSSPSFVRQPGESATYRALETPHSYPLKSGLNVKDPGAPRWAGGKDGDLRDVWKKAVQGPTGEDGKSTGDPAKILTVLGKEEVVEHKLGDISRDINALGQYLAQHAATRAALYLPNSMELLVTLFASAFYGFTPILVPQGQSLEDLSAMLKAANADTLIALAGSVPLQALSEQYPGLKQVVWLVERTSRHMEWSEVPEGVGGKAEIAVWHDIVEERRSSVSGDLISEKEPTNVVVISKDASNKSTGFQIVEFTQQNIVAAISAQISALPRPHRFGSSDLLLSLASLSSLYPLVVAFAALYSNSSLALTSVSGDNVPYDAAFHGVKPTVVIASPSTIKQACKALHDLPKGILQKYARWRQAASLAEGIMPKIAGEPRKPRLIYTFEDPASAAKEPLTLAELGDMRLLTNARTAYAFTAARVAGAIAQTSVYDYRRDEAAKQAAFGAPVSSVEFKLVDENGHKNSDDLALGKLVVSGPAVAGGETTVDRFMTITESNTLAYA
ncbi:MAG: hypothetical protein Q9206_006746 [Seirophora lacunosa]